MLWELNTDFLVIQRRRQSKRVKNLNLYFPRIYIQTRIFVDASTLRLLHLELNPHFSVPCLISTVSHKKKWRKTLEKKYYWNLQQQKEFEVKIKKKRKNKSFKSIWKIFIPKMTALKINLGKKILYYKNLCVNVFTWRS